MNDENLDNQDDEKLETKNRFQQLSEKVKQSSEAKDAAEAKAIAEADARATAEKERDFYKDFSTNVSKYPGASEFQDKILEKVKAGYSTEDAMVSVLNKEGKLIPQPIEQGPKPQVEGGSAQTVLLGDKELSDMTPAEKLQALSELDKTGALANALRGR